MRRFFSFWWRCAKIAANESVSFANDWAWLIGAPIVGGMLYLIKRGFGEGALTLSQDTTIGALEAAFLAFLITWLFAFVLRLVRAPVTLFHQEKERADRLQQKLDGLSDIRLENMRVSFDPNGPTEMYADCRISNPGSYPTIIQNWEMSVSRCNEEIKRIIPRQISTGVMRANPHSPGPPLNEDISKEPLEIGGARDLHLTFTVADMVVKDAFGAPGIFFKLTAEDIKSRVIEARYSI